MNQIGSLIINKNYDIFALTETWSKPDISDELIDIRGYQLFRNDRLTRGGGVAFYIRSELKCQILTIPNDIEQLFLSLNINSELCIIGVVYRPPKTNCKYFTDILEESLTTAMQSSDKLLMIRDINIDLLQESPFSNYLLSMFHSLEMINEATHITSELTSFSVDPILKTAISTKFFPYLPLIIKSNILVNFLLLY